jgi:YVTN family beta-propeller protein
VTNLSEGTVTPIDTARDVAGAAIPVGAFPLAIAVTPDGSTGYVTHAGGGASEGTVTPIDLATDTAGSPIVLGANPNGNPDHSDEAIAITPDGTTAYVTDRFGDALFPITLATHTVGTAIRVPHAYGVAITPDGTTAYVTDDYLEVTPVTLATGGVGPPIDVGKRGTAGIAITPDGRTAFVASDSNSTVSRIDLATESVGRAIRAGGAPQALAIAPDGATAYATSWAGTVPITIATGKPGQSIRAAAGDAIAITPKPTQWPTGDFMVGNGSFGKPKISFSVTAWAPADQQSPVEGVLRFWRGSVQGSFGGNFNGVVDCLNVQGNEAAIVALDGINGYLVVVKLVLRDNAPGPDEVISFEVTSTTPWDYHIPDCSFTPGQPAQWPLKGDVNIHDDG